MIRRETVQLSQFSLRDLIRMGAMVRAVGAPANSLPDFGQHLIDYIYDSLRTDEGEPAAALIRFFITSPYGELSPPLQAVVKATIDAPPADMKCMRLVATRGQEGRWNRIDQSSQHRVIALPNIEVVERFPMISRLMSSLGVDVHGFLPSRSAIVLENRHTGVFYVPQAEGSPYIPAQADFVVPYGIKSVVGFGDLLPDGNMFAVIIFLRVPVSAQTAELVSHLSLSTKVALLPHLASISDNVEAVLDSHLEMIDNYEEIVLQQEVIVQHAISQLARSNSLKSEFLANMSHEIRTPMTAILGFSELLASDTQLTPDESSNALDAIHRNAKYLLSIINDILDLSKIEAGKLLIERVAVNLEQIMDESLSFVRPQAAAKRLTLRVEYVGAVPEQFVTDPVRLRQVLVNLLSNAVKFTREGDVTVRISVDRLAERITFDVIDTGLGMSPEQVERIKNYSPFSQADASTTRRFGGTGLGLSIANSLARLLGGELQISSELHRGSTFSVSVSTGALNQATFIALPESSSTSPSPMRGLARPASTATEPLRPLEGIRILLAEDGLDNQRLLLFHLRKAGATVDLASDGLEALQLFETNHLTDRSPQIILLDMQMPELDGYGAARELRQRGCSTPIVALTAHAMSSDREKCLVAGCNDYLAKPINKQALIETCLRCLHSSATQANSE